MSSHLYINNHSNSDSSLPFPKPLPRSAFLNPDFDAADFLANLTSRFQTLDDLQTELRQLSTTIQTELVDLVNDHYEEFLSLGGSLSGGDEQVEELRLGLMGVERELAALKERVVGERDRLAAAMEAKREVVREANVGRRLLAVDRLLAELELGLGIVRGAEEKKGGGGEGAREKKAKKGAEAEEDDVEEGRTGLRPNGESVAKWGDEWTREEDVNPPLRLTRLVEHWLGIKHLLATFDPHHPFLAAEQTRLRRVNDTVLREIDAAIRAQTEVKAKQRLLQLRREIED
ncbi:hypothetical protein DV735_g4197, partial [Chaetothyriales sp. CBS 134920]